jgi:Putative prokaryotic signal transducing protein
MAGSFDSELEPVVVLETNNGIQLAMAKGLLEEAEIGFYTDGEIATLVPGVDGFLHKLVRIHVPRECEEEAREALEPLLSPLDET